MTAHRCPTPVERRRFLPGSVADLHVQRLDAVAARRLVGYAAVFNSPSVDLGGFREIIRPGAFRRSLAAGDDVVAVYNHAVDKIIARTSSGTLRLREDARGLAVEIDVAGTSTGDELLALIRRGDLTAMSFAFVVRPAGESWSRRKGEPPLRELRDVALLDVSVVATPAYPAAVVGLIERDVARPFAVRDAATRARRLKLAEVEAVLLDDAARARLRADPAAALRARRLRLAGAAT